MTSKMWSIVFLMVTMTCLILVGGITAAVDPFFHYHAPLGCLNYQIDNQRYQNDGIIRHFEYDAVLTGTSQTENFKVSEFNELFGTNAIKVSFSGAMFKETGGHLKNALARNPGINYVLWSIDGSIILADKDAIAYPDSFYPRYLYDENPLNDAYYLLNKDVLFTDIIIALRNTKLGYETTSFDEYSNWMNGKQFGKEAVELKYSRPPKQLVELELTEDERQIIRDNLQQNIISLIKAYPNVEFYLFFPPYSIYWWDEVQRKGTMSWQIGIFEEATRLLVGYGNVHLFSFFDDIELICNPDNYTDKIHYHENINSQILREMRNENHLLTMENYQTYWKDVEKYFDNYSFDLMFE